ncbi:MAG: hypothetical protein ACFFDT_21770 [Candidatus Hodarchaeota archaeon]
MEHEDLQKQVEQLERDKQELLRELRRLKRKPEGRIGYLLLALGLALLALAVYYSHNVSAFIGIALSFWGALLLYIRPTRFIRKEILDTITEPLVSYHKLVEELGYEGTPRHISPSTLWGLRNTVLYIPKLNHTITHTNEQLSSDDIVIDNPRAIKLNPPGQSLSRLIEEELKTNFSTVDLEYLQYNLEKALVEGLEIMETFQMELNESTVHVEMKDAIFYETIKGQIESKKQQKIGDPLNSAIACILARSTRKPVVIENIQTEPREKTIKTDFKLLEQQN